MPSTDWEPGASLQSHWSPALDPFCPRRSMKGSVSHPQDILTPADIPASYRVRARHLSSILHSLSSSAGDLPDSSLYPGQCDRLQSNFKRRTGQQTVMSISRDVEAVQPSSHMRHPYVLLTQHLFLTEGILSKKSRKTTPVTGIAPPGSTCDLCTRPEDPNGSDRLLAQTRSCFL